VNEGTPGKEMTSTKDRIKVKNKIQFKIRLQKVHWKPEGREWVEKKVTSLHQLSAWMWKATDVLARPRKKRVPIPSSSRDFAKYWQSHTYVRINACVTEEPTLGYYLGKI
jgi:hypothetical protein